MNIKSVYMVTAILTIIIFFSGIYLFYNLYNPISSHFESEIKDIKSELSNIGNEFVFFTLGDKEICPVLSLFFVESNSKLNEIGQRLKSLENVGTESKEFESLKNEFISLSIKSWILSKQLRKTCDEEIIPVMYFYSYPCEKCEQQEAILEQLKNEYSHKILVYSIDTTSQNTFARFLVSSYAIDQTPSMLIESNVYEGFQETGFLEQQLKRNITS